MDYNKPRKGSVIMKEIKLDTKPNSILRFFIASVFVPIVVALLSIFAVDKIYQNQEVITLEPRDGDVIIKDGNRYKLIQLIQESDISMSQEIQESRFNWDEDDSNKRIDILKDNANEDWSQKDSFGYTFRIYFF